MCHPALRAPAGHWDGNGCTLPGEWLRGINQGWHQSWMLHKHSNLSSDMTSCMDLYSCASNCSCCAKHPSDTFCVETHAGGKGNLQHTTLTQHAPGNVMPCCCSCCCGKCSGGTPVRCLAGRGVTCASAAWNSCCCLSASAVFTRMCPGGSRLANFSPVTSNQQQQHRLRVSLCLLQHYHAGVAGHALATQLHLHMQHHTQCMLCHN